MAASAVLQSLVAVPRPRVGHARHHLLSPPKFLPAQQASRLSVRCMAEDGPQQPAPVSPPSTSSQTPPPKPKVSTKFTDILAFSGPAPERINGRLAMVGFVAALAVELTKGDDVASQLASGGLWWFVGTSAVLSLASLIPLLKGVTVQSKSEGLMTSDAEMWNGRFAMLGIVALVLTEYLKGGALV